MNVYQNDDDDVLNAKRHRNKEKHHSNFQGKFHKNRLLILSKKKYI